jgi:hypothetical protein
MAMRVVLAGAAVAGSLQAWWTPGFSAGVMAFVRDLDLPLVGSFFEMPPDWTRSLAGVIVVLVASVIAWVPFASAWSYLAAADQDTYFQGIMERPLWDLRWWTLGAAFLALAVGVGVLLFVLGNPVLAGAYAVATAFATLLGLTVISSGGTTLTDTETPEKPMAALRKITGRTQTGIAATAAAALMVVAVPVIVVLLWNPVLGWTLAVEGLVLSAVLVIEGTRQYGLFRTAFNDLARRGH